LRSAEANVKNLFDLQSTLADHTGDHQRRGVSRRELLAGASFLGAMTAMPAAAARAEITSQAVYATVGPYGGKTLPAGVRVRLVPNVNGLTVNMLEAGTPGRPLVLLLHGFPNLGYSWRKVMPALAAAGYYAVSPDLRGYGRTTGWDNSFDADFIQFLSLNQVRDQIALVHALGYRTAAMVVGHDTGAGIAVNSALIRPDIFLRLTFLGGQGGPPPSSFPFDIANGAPLPHPDYTNAELDAAYAQLNPPRRAYGNYWASKQADDDMKHLPAGMTMSSFFRAFYYMKSHDFPGNQNLKPLHAVHTAREAAEQDAIIPEYYVMRRDRSMPTTMAAYMPSKEYIDNCKWFTPAECDVYGQEYTLSGWTGALHNYRRAFFPGSSLEMMTFAGRTVDVPTQIISGKQDWGANRGVGGPEKAGQRGFTKFKGVHMVDGGGHWVHEEQPEIVSRLLTGFLDAS
jgi:pimeloyl-ACP methyl ester carboxylesterase